MFSLKNISSPEKKVFITPDTALIYHVTDSVATIELKKYDEQSGRQTGVPRMLCHYTKSISYDKNEAIAFVYYHFSTKLFYGNEKTETIKSTGFPDFISISYQLTTKKIRILPEG